MKQLNDLPALDLYPLIFRNLSIKDLFNCRLVNKQFKYFSDHTKGINKLIIGQPDLRDGDDYYWYFNNKLIEDKDIISLECFRTIKLLSIFNLDKYLKYLSIYDQQFKLKELSNLINLESLEFNQICYINKQHVINLKNLKVFVAGNQSFRLNTPKLEKIKFNYINEIELNSESIKHLITIDYDSKFEAFKNLEIIEFVYTTDRSINENLLTTFKNLKQLKIKLRSISNYSNERMENSLIKILDDKIKLEKKIDIYLEGIKIENIDKLNELKAFRYSEWKFRLNNYDLSDSNLSFINCLYYDELERCVNNIKNDLPSTFFDKFQHIRNVNVIRVKDAANLNWFLNNLKYLTRLKINSGISLGQVFYNNLPDTIRFLIIHDRKDINYDFISKLTKLIEFRTYSDNDLFNLAFNSFLNLKYLQNFRFDYGKKEILIEKFDEKFYLNGQKLDYNQLIEECDKIRLKRITFYSNFKKLFHKFF